MLTLLAQAYFEDSPWAVPDHTKTAKLAQGHICPKITGPDYCQVPLDRVYPRNRHLRESGKASPGAKYSEPRKKPA
jgi:hypothetical protein